MNRAFGPFHYRGARLYSENVALATIARRTGTPLYVYSAATIRQQYRAFDEAFTGVPHEICYAVKANGNLAILRLLAQAGAGMDIVSGGELFRALKAGAPARRIVFSGVGKTADEMAAALRAGILCFNVESRAELETLHGVARRLKRRAPVSIRVNPDVKADTHRHIATGSAENKFGVPYEEAPALYARAHGLPGLRIVGIQSHIGSQILDVRPFRQTLEKILKLVDRLQTGGILLEHIDVGGGLGITYNKERPLLPAALAKALLPLWRGRRQRLIFEPGRYMVAAAGGLVTRVLYNKSTRHKNFVVVDGAMNDLARPALYDAYHPIWPVARNGSGAIKADVVGPVCESGDYFAKARAVAKVRPGDYLAVLAAGAYGFSMSSQYNARPRAAEVLVDGAKWRVVRSRETLNDLIRGEKL